MNSSWMVVLMAVPMFAAFGVAYHGGPLFPLLVLAVFVPFLVVPGGDRQRDHADAREHLPGAAHARHPERHRRARGGRRRAALPHRAARAARASRGVPLAGGVRRRAAHADVAVPAERVGAARGARVAELPARLPAALPAVEHRGGGLRARRAAASRALHATASARRRRARSAGCATGALAADRRTALLSPLGILRRELVLKELRLFFRDTTQWSQLILLAVLVVVYVFNIKYLPLRGEGITFFLVNVIPFLNLVLAGFVLASIAARFIFPSVSLEGRTLWLLRSSPMPVRDLLWAKFWVGTTAAAGARARHRGRDERAAPGERLHVRGVGDDDHADDASRCAAWRSASARCSRSSRRRTPRRSRRRSAGWCS